MRKKIDDICQFWVNFFNAERCASGAPRGSSFACGGSVELLAWLCACVRASDALRRVPARRVLKLSRINGFHLHDLLHGQQFLLVREFEKWKVSI